MQLLFVTKIKITVSTGERVIVMDMQESVRNLKGVGEKTAAILQKLNILTINDLLHYYPRDYRRYEAPLTIDDTSADDKQAAAYLVRIQGQATLSGRGRRPVVTLNIHCQTGNVRVVWFNSPYIRQQLTPGDSLIFYGKISLKGKTRTLEHPEVYTPEQYEEKSRYMQPVYAMTDGITANQITKLVRLALENTGLMPETLPEWFRRRYKLPEINFALHQIHFPEDEVSLTGARSRLVFEEFFAFILAMKLLKNENLLIPNAFPVTDPDRFNEFTGSLPYKMTNAQDRVCHEIIADLTGNKAMNRLVQGDVGSGKTLIAAGAMYLMAVHGYQSCMMAPTEVLARQHYETLSGLFEPLGIRLTLLTGSMTQSQKKKAYDQISSFESDIIIGTQALFQEKAIYARLGLIVTDEQHRFGVAQRQRLADKSGSGSPHVLVMSATPIPRTLALIIYGDMDVSVVDEKPVGRLPIKNCVVGTSYRKTAYRFMQEQISQGHQVYIICPMVEESEQIEAENVTDYVQMLRENMPPHISIEGLHGKMKAKDKQDIMERFGEGKISILVSTTVVEVGVDVPNATVMMIENAERFGLAQLHQLRGRIGRGKAQSYCIFMYGTDQQKVRQRLDIMQKTNDGFVIAEEDMKMRGPGELFGVRQSGVLEFKLGDIYADSKLLKEAAQAAAEITGEDPELEKNENEAFRRLALECMSGNTENITL